MVKRSNVLQGITTVIIVLGLVLGVYLVQRPTNFLPKAYQPPSQLPVPTPTVVYCKSQVECQNGYICNKTACSVRSSCPGSDFGICVPSQVQTRRGGAYPKFPLTITPTR